MHVYHGRASEQLAGAENACFCFGVEGDDVYRVADSFCDGDVGEKKLVVLVFSIALVRFADFVFIVIVVSLVTIFLIR